jgi:hypothetical protein
MRKRRKGKGKLQNSNEGKFLSPYGLLSGVRWFEADVSGLSTGPILKGHRTA